MERGKSGAGVSKSFQARSRRDAAVARLTFADRIFETGTTSSRLATVYMARRNCVATRGLARAFMQ
jgi:hypothetical protein